VFETADMCQSAAQLQTSTAAFTATAIIESESPTVNLHNIATEAIATDCHRNGYPSQ
jgi:hypothetical protein